MAASEAAGLRENFGTMTKPLHAGRAAESGIVAADLAARGWTAAEQILEAPRGFFRAAGGGYDPNAIVHKLGRPWTFRQPGVSIEPYPSGSLTHPGMTEMARLIRTRGIQAQQVERVYVGTNRNMPNALIHHQPKTGWPSSAWSSVWPSCCCTAKLGLTEFTGQVVNRPEVQELISRIHLGVNPVAEAAGYNKMTSILDIRLRDGRTISGRADFAMLSGYSDDLSGGGRQVPGLRCFRRLASEKANRVVETVAGLKP